MINDIIKFNTDAGNTTDHFNVRQSALYLGLQCEELAEKLHAVGMHGIASSLDDVSGKLKKGLYDSAVNHANRKEMLDADMDLIVVSVGAAISQGADPIGALAEVIRSNDSKRTDGKLVKDIHGKIIKGPDFSEPNLTPFMA